MLWLIDLIADTISQRTEHLCGTSKHGSDPNRQRERHGRSLRTPVFDVCAERSTDITQEIKFGDNDTLSAITAAMVQADYLFLMTDVDCLYDKNPRIHADAQAIEVVQDISSLAVDVSTSGSSLGTGGMSTKIVAARLATSAGVMTVITRSSNPGNIINIIKHVQAFKGTPTDSPSPPGTPTEETLLARSIPSFHIDGSLKPPLHTRFIPNPNPIRDRRFWLSHGLAPRGTIYIDEGAHRALVNKAGLLPVGVVDVEGSFAQHEAVRLVVVKRPPTLSTPAPVNPLPNGSSNHEDKSEHYEKIVSSPSEVGRALVNYSATQVRKIKGLRSTEIQSQLGYADSEYVALRENISLLQKVSKGSGTVTPTLGEAYQSEC